MVKMVKHGQNGEKMSEGANNREQGNNYCCYWTNKQTNIVEQVYQ